MVGAPHWFSRRNKKTKDTYIADAVRGKGGGGPKYIKGGKPKSIKDVERDIAGLRKGTYAPESKRLLISCNPAEGGIIDPAPGTYLIERGRNIDIKLVGENSGYLFMGWRIDGNFERSTGLKTLEMDKDHIVVAEFRKINEREEITGLDLRMKPVTIYVTWSPPGAGKTNPDRGEYVLNPGEELACFAHPATERGYSFRNWVLDGKIAGKGRKFVFSNTTTFFNKHGISGDKHTLTAVFEGEEIEAVERRQRREEEEEQTPPPIPPVPPVPPVPPEDNVTLTIECDPAAGGTTAPYAPGVHRFRQGERIIVEATANAGFTFVGWNLDNRPFANRSRIAVHMNEDHYLIAEFEQENVPPPPPPPERPGRFIVLVQSTPLEGVNITIRGRAAIADADINAALGGAANPANLGIVKTIMTGLTRQNLESEYEAYNWVAQALRASPIPRAVHGAVANLIVQGRFGGNIEPGYLRPGRRYWIPKVAGLTGPPRPTQWTTTFEVRLDGGTYIFTAPETFPQNAGADKQYKFVRWEIFRPSGAWRLDSDVMFGIHPMGRRAPPPIRRGRPQRQYLPGTPLIFEGNIVTALVDEGGDGTAEFPDRQPFRLVAIYERSFTLTGSPEISGAGTLGMGGRPYNVGAQRVLNRTGVGAKDLGVNILNRGPFRRGNFIDEARMKGGFKALNEKAALNPLLNAAVNKGKRMLNQFARAEYSNIFTTGPNAFLPKFRRRRQDLELLARDAKAARRTLARALRNRQNFLQVGTTLLGQSGARDNDLLSMAKAAADAGNPQANNQAFQDASFALQKYREEERAYYQDFTKEMQAATAGLQDELEKRARYIAITVCRRFRIGISISYNSGQRDPATDQQYVEAQLLGYAQELAQEFAARGRSASFALSRGIANIGRGLQTVGAGWTNLWYNLWGLIIGPWTIHTIFVLIQFFFILQYVGYDPNILWLMPLISAVFTFLLSFENARTPLDWIANLSTGAMMGYSALLLMTIVGAFFWFDGGLTWTFWIIWAVLALFIGNFQIFQTSGYKAVLQASVVILLFSYVALGPYSGYYQQALDQVRPAAELAYSVVSNAVNDVYLLATNPTEWYSRQQRLNAVPEKPLSIAKGIEVIALDGLPQNVPAGLDFALASVIKNDGELDEAQHISISFDCNAYCDKTFSKVAPTRSPPSSFLDSLPPGMKSQYHNQGEFYLATRMRKGETEIFNIQPFIAKTLTQRRAETQFAKVNMTITYVYTASSSLLVTTIDQDTLQQRFRQGEDVFKQVAATAKVTPARLSLNVGPQPLVFKTPDPSITDLNKVLLLVSISSARDDSTVLLTQNTKIILKVPRILAAHDPSTVNVIDCGPPDVSTVDVSTDPDNYIVTYTPRPTGEYIEIETYKTNTIYSFLCKLPLTPITGTKTSLITAEIGSQVPVQIGSAEEETQTYDINNGYFVKTTKEKGVIVTAPIGILFEPYEQECRKVDVSEGHDTCVAIKDPTGNPARTCYWEYAGAAVKGNFPWGDKLGISSCHVCGSQQQCGKFLTPDTCDEAPSQCGWNCKWNPDAIHPKTGQKNGACEDAAGTVPAQQPVQQIAQGIITQFGKPCSQVPICTPVVFIPYPPQAIIQGSGIRPGDAVFSRAVGAVMAQESGCAHYYSASEVKCSVSDAIGAMQILASTAAGHGYPNPADLCDPQMNTNAGSNYLNYLSTLYGGAATSDDQWHLAFAAYHAGETKINAAVRSAGAARLPITWNNVKQFISSADPLGVRTVDYAEQTFTRFKFPTNTNNCYLKV